MLTRVMLKNDVASPISKPGTLVKDPGCIFNTGYLAVFLVLTPYIGFIPLVIMFINWIIGVVIVCLQKNILHDRYKNNLIQLIGEGFYKKYIERPNASLATNGGFLLLAGAFTISISLFSKAFIAQEQVNLFSYEFFIWLITNKLILTSIVALGFGISNIKKAAELDNYPSSLHSIFPFLYKTKSEYIVALSTLCLCLLTGGWSLLALPIIYFSLKLSLPEATTSQSGAFKLTVRLINSNQFLLKTLLDRKHPLTISRLAISVSLILSVFLGLLSLIIALIVQDDRAISITDLSIIGNLLFASANFRLYQLTDKSLGVFTWSTDASNATHAYKQSV
jgi:hypothetical protein